MREKHFIVATAGHVDHGKSALVKALTGTDPGRLPEEKARQITIDLGFAELNLATSDGSRIHVGMIDVPGHEDLVRNMIAGVGVIDLALLAIAVDDGWMLQTEEHLQILSYLGVKRIVVALNKSDLGGVDSVSSEIREQLRDTPYHEAKIVPTSAHSGNGIEQLKQVLATELAGAQPPRDIGKARLFVDRAFTLTGIGPVVTGTLSGGPLTAGQTVYLQPGNFPTRIRSIQSHHSDVPHAEPGMRTALNLVDLPKVTSGKSVRRGNIITSEKFAPSLTLDVLVQRSGRLQAGNPAARPLKNGASVYLHYGTGRLSAMLISLRNEPLRAGEGVIGQLRLRSPLLAFSGDRFVLRDQSDQNTIAGGIILDPDASPKSFRTEQTTKRLQMRMNAPDDVKVFVESDVERYGAAVTSNLLIKSNFSRTEIDLALTQLHKEGRLVLAGHMVADSEFWKTSRARAAEIIDHAHRMKSEKEGISLNELRTSLADLSSEAFDSLVADICNNGFVRRGSIIARSSHRATLPPHLEAAANGLLKTLSQKPFDPPGRKQLATDASTRQVLTYLIEQGEAIEISADIILSRDAFTRSREIISQFISTNGAASVSDLRQALQTSRRVIVPLLERLDRDRVTRRLGDQRTLIQKL